MLLYEVLSTASSSVDWFTQAMILVFDNAYHRAESAFHSTEDPRVANMQAGMVLGKWYSTNVINTHGYSISEMVSLLKPHSIKIPDILADKRMKQEQQYSSSKNLRGLIEQLIPVLVHKGYERQSKILSNTISTFYRKMHNLLSGPQQSPEEPAKKPVPLIGQQREKANQIVQDIIQSLPDNIRELVRVAVARQGNTLFALRDELNKRGIKLK